MANAWAGVDERRSTLVGGFFSCPTPYHFCLKSFEHIVYIFFIFFLSWNILWVKTDRGSLSVSFLVPRFPSKSGLIHKHIVKHIRVNVSFLSPWFRYPPKSGLLHKHIVKHIMCEG
jgi:hypothetical protein